MKTNNYINNKIWNLLFITFLIIAPLIGSAQIDLISGGKVGIGIIPNSGYKLHIYTPSDNDQALLLERAGGIGSATMGFKSGVAGLTGIEGGGSTGHLSFYTGGSERVKISSGGNFGVGTTPSTYKFHIKSPISQDQVLLLERDGDASATLGFKSSVTGLTGIDGGGSTARLSFYTAGSARINITSSGNVGIGTSGPTHKLEVSGSTWCTSGNWSNSDIRFKKNVQPIDNALEKIMLLNGKTYQFKTTEYPKFGFEEGEYIGFIAQELIAVFPEAVRLHDSGYYAVNYDAIIPVLAEAVKEQNKKLDSLISKISNQDSINQALQTLITNCCIANTQGLRMNNNDNPNGTNNSLSIGINDSNLENKSTTAPILYQNNPNPFSNQTNINYFIPSTAQSASIMIFDLQGKLVKTLSISSFEQGSITINGYELNAGMFVYSLIVDGKIVDTKNMILTQ